MESPKNESSIASGPNLIRYHSEVPDRSEAWQCVPLRPKYFSTQAEHNDQLKILVDEYYQMKSKML